MSNYQELYKKYRPNTWDEIVGQEDVVNSLKASIASDNLPSAYGFFGAHGCGKALHKDTLIPTPDGFKTMGAINVGDYVLGSSSNPVRVLDKYCPQDPQSFLITFDDDTTVATSAGHLWTINTFAGKDVDSVHNTLTTQEMYDNMISKNSGMYTIATRGLGDFSQYNGVFENLGVASAQRAAVSVDSYLSEASDNIVYDTNYNTHSAYVKFTFDSTVASSVDLTENINVMKALGGIVSFNEWNEITVVEWFGIDNSVFNMLALCKAKGENVSVSESGGENEISHYIINIEEIEDNPEDYFCITVDAEDKLFLCTESFIPTHNTSTAKILAKAVNCTASKDGVNPCGVCENCVSIDNDSSLDVYYESMANAGGADNVRAIMDKAEYEPRGKKGIFILDEVHNLSKAAFDAMLIPLEKEDSPTVFILCSTEPEKIPKTIHSRIQGRNFQKIDNKSLYAHISNIVKKEGIEVDKALLLEVVRRGKGSVRDTLKFLEEVRNGSALSDSFSSENEFAKDIFKTIFAAKDDFSCMSAVLGIIEEADKETSIESLLHQLFKTARKTIVNLSAKGKNSVGTRNNAYPVLRDMMVLFGEAIDKCNAMDGVEERFYLETAVAQLLTKHPVSKDVWSE